ncbi:hypothetical protein FA13DRAFT_99458 [Coprinellus micaceus]|uniref:Uncharacterized protein n=1 Tax=Coprinellus micaceus TaxID=71717 RepID=A0A4Y7SIF6_COPMI|nr:hypothetical protein FA13DRAFT_99458 [Coprinellus micaceus]
MSLYIFRRTRAFLGTRIRPQEGRTSQSRYASHGDYRRCVGSAATRRGVMAQWAAGENRRPWNSLECFIAGFEQQRGSKQASVWVQRSRIPWSGVQNKRVPCDFARYGCLLCIRQRTFDFSGTKSNQGNLRRSGGSYDSGNGNWIPSVSSRSFCRLQLPHSVSSRWSQRSNLRRVSVAHSSTPH